MKSLIIFTLLFLTGNIILAQPADLKNDYFLRLLYKDQPYNTQKDRVLKEFAHVVPGSWGEFVKGVDEDMVTNKKLLALTFDACGGPRGSGYDAELINYLRKEKIPATLFVTGKWIDANYNTFLELSKDTLFEIENHGLNHQPCSVDGESEYGIKGTRMFQMLLMKLKRMKEKFSLSREGVQNSIAPQLLLPMKRVPKLPDNLT